MTRKSSVCSIALAAFGFYLVSTEPAVASQPAASSTVIAHVSFIAGAKKTEFSVIDTKSPTQGMKLRLKSPFHKTKEKSVSQSQADFFISEMTRIIWSSRAKRTSSKRPCTRYVSMTVGDDHATICSEDSAETGRSYALLNALQHHFD